MIHADLRLPATVHIPDFAAVTDDERAVNYSSRCATCGQLLWSGIEIIGSTCPGGERQEDA